MLMMIKKTSRLFKNFEPLIENKKKNFVRATAVERVRDWRGSEPTSAIDFIQANWIFFSPPQRSR